MSTNAPFAARFRNGAANDRSLHLSAAAVVVALAALAAVGLIGSIVPVTLFAVGAGAGYSLSGSV